MKRKIFDKKLALSKATVADLNKNVMEGIKGGLPPTWRITCYPYCNTNYTCGYQTVCGQACWSDEYAC